MIEIEKSSLMTKVTITNVANEVGISKTTVSRYLNGQYNRININTQHAIQEAIDALGYVPNQQARSLKLKESHLIGLVIADMANTYSSHLISGIQNVFRQQGYSLMIFDSANVVEQEKHALNQLLAANVDGLILQPLVKNSEQYQFLSERNVPVVLVDRQTEPQIWPSVTSDNYSASKNMAKILLDKQYKQVIFLDSHDENPWTNQLRYDGIASITSRSDMDLTYVQVEMSDFSPLAAILDAHKGPAPVIFAANGELLLKCLSWLKSRQIAVPTEVAVTGYDDSTLGDLITPGITGVVQNPQVLGETTANSILNHIKQQSNIVDQIEIPSQIIERASC